MDRDLRERLFGSRLRVAAVAVLALAALVVAAFVLGILGTPTVTGVDNRFGGVNESTTVIESDLHVRNPNPFGASLGGLRVDYAASLNGVRMANGTRRGVSIGRGRSTLPFTTFLDNERVPAWWVTHVRRGERTTLRVNADVHSATANATFGAPKVTRTVETDLLSGFNSTDPRPVDAGVPVVSDPVVYVNETAAWWGPVDAGTTRMRARFTLYNPKPYPVAVSTLGYEVGMNGVAVGSGTTDRSAVVPPGETRTVRARTIIDNSRLDEWWVTHLERTQTTTLRIRFFTRLDLRATTVRVPLDTHERTVETDIFGTKGDAGGGTATPSPTATSGTPTAGGGTTRTPTLESTTVLPPVTETTGTPTGTPTATPTPTPTPVLPPPDNTTTDDGILAVGRSGP